MKAKAKRNSKQKEIEYSKNYIYFRIPLKHNEKTIKDLLKKFSCECECK